MHNLIFTTLAVPGRTDLDALLLAASLRRFGGQLAHNPLWVCIPDGLAPLSDESREAFARLDVQIIPLTIDTDLLKFPFAAKVVVAAGLEALAQDQAERLAFLDPDTLFLQEPAEFLLPDGKQLGYRPVHHRLIGPAYEEAPDRFWQQLYEACLVPDGRHFPMTTHIGEVIGPYFNAGVLVVRPQAGLLARWQQAFLDLYRRAEISAYYQQDTRYAIFIHQAVLTVVLLAALEPQAMLGFSPRINYPLHLHTQVPAELRPASLVDLVTARFENIFDHPDWESELPVPAELQNWLQQQPRLQAAQWEAT